MASVEALWLTPLRFPHALVLERLPLAVPPLILQAVALFGPLATFGGVSGSPILTSGSVQPASTGTNTCLLILSLPSHVQGLVTLSPNALMALLILQIL